MRSRLVLWGARDRDVQVGSRDDWVAMWPERVARFKRHADRMIFRVTAGDWSK